nr:HAD family hydrolase [Micromonospora acroterricola]
MPWTMNGSPVSCVFLDFFGTLVDYSPSRTEQGFHRSHALLRSMGLRMGYDEFLHEWSAESSRLDEVTQTSHREFSMEDVTSDFLKRLTKSDPAPHTVAQFVEVYLDEWNKGVRYPADAPMIVATLASRFRLAVVTNTHKADLVPRHLANMGIADFFDSVVTSLEVGWRKPHPAIFAEALDQMRVAPSDAVFVGDNYTADYLGSKAAGIDGLLIDPTCRYDIPEQDRLRSLGDILQLAVPASA